MSTIDDSALNQSDTSLPIINHSGRDVFQFEGKSYLINPTIPEFLVEAGILSPRYFRSIVRELQSQGIRNLPDMVNLNKSQLMSIANITNEMATKLFIHLVRVKQRGPLLLRGAQLEELNSDVYHLQFVNGIDTALFQSTTGSYGLRSKSVIELCGAEDVGKTQWCLTALCSMLEVGRTVVYIDSEGGFDIKRIQELAMTTKLSRRSLTDNILFAPVDGFDELDLVLDEITPIILR